MGKIGDLRPGQTAPRSWGMSQSYKIRHSRAPSRESRRALHRRSSLWNRARFKLSAGSGFRAEHNEIPAAGRGYDGNGGQPSSEPRPRYSLRQLPPRGGSWHRSCSEQSYGRMIRFGRWASRLSIGWAASMNLKAIRRVSLGSIRSITSKLCAAFKGLLSLSKRFSIISR